MKRRRVNGALLAAALLVVIVAWWIGAQGGAPGARDDAGFAGTDAAVTAQLAADGHRAWVTPLFRPGSAEVESGLFAVQAAVGGACLGYCLGRLRERSLASSAAPGPAGTPGPAS